jgi:hypothetical protein
MREKNFGFWSINMEISINTKTRLFPHLLVKINNYFSFTCWRAMFCFSVHSPWEKNLKSFPFKMVLSWKQCSCDVIIDRMYCPSMHAVNMTFCGPAHDTVLTNRQTGKLNFDNCYIIIRLELLISGNNEQTLVWIKSGKINRPPSPASSALSQYNLLWEKFTIQSF